MSKQSILCVGFPAEKLFSTDEGSENGHIETCHCNLHVSMLMEKINPLLFPRDDAHIFGTTQYTFKTKLPRKLRRMWHYFSVKNCTLKNKYFHEGKIFSTN